MTFDEVLAHVLDLLQRQGRVSYRALKRWFDLDDEYLEALKAEIIQGNASRWTKMVLCWSGAANPCRNPPVLFHLSPNENNRQTYRKTEPRRAVRR